MKDFPIRIHLSPTADSRTCSYQDVSKNDLLVSTSYHIDDVRKGIFFFQELLSHRALSHDHTKISHIDMFYEDFRTGFLKQDWYNLHKERERHHLKMSCQQSYGEHGINLIDILENIIDGVMAGMARSGSYTYEPISPELLQMAVANTASMLLNVIEVVPS